MARRLAQRLPRELAALLLGLGEGVAAAQVQRARQRGLERGFDAARDGLVDIDVGGGRVARGIGRSALRAGDARDLVVELVVEHRQACRQAGAVVVEHAQFLAQRGFGLQVGVAVDVAAAAGLAPVAQGLAQRGRAKAGGHAALDGPLRVEVPHAVQARAPLRSALAVVVVAQAAGQGEVLAQAPLVLGEPGVLRAIGRGARRTRQRIGRRVAQVLLVVVHARGQQVLAAQRRHPAAVEHRVPDGHVARQVARFLALQIGVGGSPAPAALVLQRVVLALELAVAGRIGGQQGHARRRNEVLARSADLGDQVVVLAGGQRQAQVQRTVVALVVALVDAVLVALAVVAVQAQAQQVGLDRA